MLSSKPKIFDITPPRKKAAIAKIQQEGPRKDFAPPSNSSKKLAPLLAGIVLLSAAALSYFLIPHKVKVELWPEKKILMATTTAAVSVDGRGANFINGEILESEKVISQSFAVQGKKMKSSKAQGIIRVYNNYSALSQPLLATTRFISDDGRLFRAPERVVVPGGHYEGGKFAAGFIDIKVVADQPGEEYNIDESTFSIPGFAGTPKYTAFYAKSSSPMSGGYKKEVPYVTQEDLNRAGEFLAKTALAENDIAIRKAASSGKYSLIDGAILANVSDFKSSAGLGQEVDSFFAQIKTRAAALVFKEDALIDFSKKYLSGILASGEKLIEQFLKIEYSPEKVELEKNELSLSIFISAQSHSLPEDAKIKELTKNKGLKEIENIFKGFPQIIKAKVEFWPFWVNLAPDDVGRIEVVLHLD